MRKRPGRKKSEIRKRKKRKGEKKNGVWRKKENAELKNYQNEAVFLSEAQKKEREQAIVDKEKEASELRKKYFGPQGELYKKRIALIEPIQDEVYNAIKGIAQQRGYQLVLDRATETAGIIFASPSIDISNEVLAKLGYEK